MSGHSKWKTNKGKKAVADAKKGATYTRLIKEITIIAREGGGNPDQNSKLRTVIARAKEANSNTVAEIRTTALCLSAQTSTWEYHSRRLSKPFSKRLIQRPNRDFGE